MKTGKIAKYFSFGFSGIFFILQALYCSEMNSAHAKMVLKSVYNMEYV